MTPAYRGRFAPSPTGPLHAGSLVAALASALDAQQHGGEWQVRIEDLDNPRCSPHWATDILRGLTAHGFVWHGEPVYQSERHAIYQTALTQLEQAGHLYPCACSRREIADSSQRGIEGPVYPGTCHNGLDGRPARAWRLRVGNAVTIRFTDRLQGTQQQDLSQEVGDFVLHRSDGLIAYQLAVVVDDAEAGITDIVRGADLLASTPRQIHLQSLLGLPTPRYLHLPVLCNPAGEKLSKQSGATALDPELATRNLVAALDFLGQSPPDMLARQRVRDVWEWSRQHWRSENIPQYAKTGFSFPR
jgi:glutamyl-Q tRNA(Asp) synthetase